MATDAEVKQVEQVVDRLQARFSHFPSQRVAEVVGEIYADFDDAKIRDFVPILLERSAADRLAHLIA